MRLCQGMLTQNTHHVGTLPEDEAWPLFEDGAEAVARCVALRDVKDAYEREHALKQLQSSDSQIPGMRDRCWMWDGLIDEEEGNVEDQINEGHAIVNGLTHACMLQASYEDSSETIEHV
ncbi:hypothetical protein ACLOJK_026603 [Asimina triloba]